MVILTLTQRRGGVHQGRNGGGGRGGGSTLVGGDEVKQLWVQRPSHGCSQIRGIWGKLMLEGLVWLLGLMLQQSPWGGQGVRCSLGRAGPLQEAPSSLALQPSWSLPVGNAAC